MTTNSTRLYEGEWRNLGNPSWDSQDSIHEDSTAREFGFKGGLVTGSIVATRALPAVVEHFGPAFFEGGWYAFRFIGGIYEGDPVREYAELPRTAAAISSRRSRSRTARSVPSGAPASAPVTWRWARRGRGIPPRTASAARTS